MALGILIFLSISLFAIATNTESGWLFAVDSILIALILSSLILPTLALRGMEVKREMSEEVFEGELFRVTLRIRPRSFLGRMLLEIQDIVPRGLESSGNRAFWGMMPKEGAKMKYEVVAKRRGSFAFEDLLLRSYFPLGIFGRRRMLKGERKEVLVLPSFVDIGSLPILLGSRFEMAYSGNPVRDRGLDFRSIREYIPGEGLRRIHWRTSARVGKPMIMEFEERGYGDIGIALDLWNGQDPDCFDVAVRVMASISRYLERCGIRWSAFGLKDGEVVGPEEEGWIPLLRWLARIEPDSRTKLGDSLRARSIPEWFRTIIFVTSDRDLEVGPFGNLLKGGIGIGAILVGNDMEDVERDLETEGIRSLRILPDLELGSQLERRG